MGKYDYIKEIRIWNVERIVTMCIHHQWYTRGNNTDYSDMLDSVRAVANPTTQDILKVANDIYRHSNRLSCETVGEVATAIINEAIAIYFEEV